MKLAFGIKGFSFDRLHGLLAVEIDPASRSRTLGYQRNR